jgi:general secretion pathway protein I
VTHTRPHHSRGFTLVEVLVALVIVAVGMAAVLGALNSAAQSTSYFRDKTFAQWVALNRIAEVRLQRQRRVSEGKTKGDAELAGRKWRWEQEVTELDIPGVMRIDVRVQFADTGQRDSWIATSTGIVGDAVSDPDPAKPVWQLPPGGPGQTGDGDGSGNPGEGGDGTEQPPPPQPGPDPGTIDDPPPRPPPGEDPNDQ